MSTRAAGLSLLAFGLLATAGCDGCRDKPQPITDQTDLSGPPQTDKPKGSGKAVLRGVVRLAEGAELPSYGREQMVKRVLAHTQQSALPETCSPPKTTDRQPVQLTPEGLLTNVVLAASDFSRQPERAPKVQEVVIEDCRLTPPVIVAMKGDQLRVRNAGDYPFMPTYGESPVVKTLISGQSYEAQLDKPGVAPLLCGFTAPCGRTDVVVMLHPVHATTNAEGKFEFESFPAGETVKLSAWHPLFQETTIEVRLEPGEEKSVELVLSPLAPQGGAAEDTKAQIATDEPGPVAQPASPE